MHPPGRAGPGAPLRPARPARRARPPAARPRRPQPYPRPNSRVAGEDGSPPSSVPFRSLECLRP